MAGKKTKKPESKIVQAISAQLPAGYAELLEDLKARIRSAQTRAGLAVNRELVMLYWDVGCRILKQQKTQGWGAKVVERLARDLRSAFPDMKGFSRANLLYMRAFAAHCPDVSIVQQVAGQLPYSERAVSVNMEIRRLSGGCKGEQKVLAKVSRYHYNICVKSICPPLNQLLHESARCPQRGFVFLGGKHAR